jgi:hypothetical protein
LAIRGFWAVSTTASDVAMTIEAATIRNGFDMAVLYFSSSIM